MGSKGRMPPPHMRHPHQGPGMVHPDPYGHGGHPSSGNFLPYDMLPPPEVMEQKFATQHVEMQRLVTENQRLLATHGVLRQELAGAQHELEMLHVRTEAMKSEGEQQMRNLMDKIAKMEPELQAAESMKLELQQARAEAQNLVVVTQELQIQRQQLGQELQRVHSEVQQVPALKSELDGLMQEFQHCRATYDYEKKLYSDHVESLKLMENNYLNMSLELEKLRASLANSTNAERRPSGPYGGYSENEASGHHSVGQNAYEDGYGVPQGHAPLPGGGGSGGVPPAGIPAYPVPQSGAPPVYAGYEAQRAPAYDAQRAPAYDSQRGGVGGGYDAQRGVGGGYDAQRGAGGGYDAPRGVGGGYDSQRGVSSGYDTQRGSGGGYGYDLPRGGQGYDAPRGGAGYDMQRGGGVQGYDGQEIGMQGYDAQKGGGYDAQNSVSYDAASRGGVPGAHGQAGHTSNVPYGSATPPARAGGYEAQPRGGNPVRR